MEHSGEIENAKKRFLFYLGHPAHFHNVKNVSKKLIEAGHQVLFVAREKDVLFSLLTDQEIPVIYLKGKKGNGNLGLILSILRREKQIFDICRNYKPQLLVGTDLVITHIGKVLNIPSVILNEDDSRAVPLMAKFAFPFATHILAPNCCDQYPANHKKTGYSGYHELAYLHPLYFTPDKKVIENLVDINSNYFILRFAKLSAHHDKGKNGISDKLALQIIELIRPFGKIYITSERTLSPALEPYRLPIPPFLMHHALAFSRMYIGDSQTMTAEAAVLGVPAIRFNDFIGELNYLEELEHRFGLTRGIKTNQQDLLLQTIADWIQDTSQLEKWKVKKEKMLAQTIDVTEFWKKCFLSWAR